MFIPLRNSLVLLLCFGFSVAGCEKDLDRTSTSMTDATKRAATQMGPIASPTDRDVTYTEVREPCAEFSAERLPLFGDLHVHSNFSFDAAANTIGATPADAYRYGRGQSIDFWPVEDGQPVGKTQIDRPLDFLAVTDHGEFLGERSLCREKDSPRYDTPFCKASRVNERQGMILLAQVITVEEPVRIPELCGEDGTLCREYAEAPWKRIGAAAEEAYDRSERCGFTTFKAYEYTGTPNTSNYHRNVIFRNANVPALPVSYIDAPYDSALWNKLDATCLDDEGCDYLTIPHNTNLANGRMGPYLRLDPTLENKRAYAKKRLEREPIIEIFQHKGGSECINGLSSVLGQPDELCNVEAVRTIGRRENFQVVDASGSRANLIDASEVTRECQNEIGANGMLGAGCVDASDYLRSGLLVGLEEEGRTGLNPIKLGVIASTDTHTATPGGVSERNWGGHVSVEATPTERLQPGLLTSGIDGNPGGLAGVWAIENSRDAIFEAMQRREVFGTSGPRIAPRFFAGWDYEEDLCESKSMVKTAYANGVPMGGDLSSTPTAGSKPTFLGAAMRDATEMGAPLQKMQLIKGWIDAQGQRRSEVITIAGGPNGASVDPATGERQGSGHDGFCTVYRDDDFDPRLPTYYYLRVVENPSPRWSFFDCQRLSPEERPAACSDGTIPSTIQEMAWSSPIWYRP